MKETVEEAAERIYPTPNPYIMGIDLGNSMRREAFKEGAKWQAERMYSEEEVLTIIDKYQVECQFKYNTGTVPDGREWFEQFKKKV